MKSFKSYVSEKFSGDIRGKSFGHRVGFWLSPQGELIGTSSVHITDIIQNPRKFGVTTDWIESKYDEYGERMGTEGSAREDIIRHVVKRGWIRVRRYTRPDYWSTTVYMLNRSTKENIESWVKAFADEGIMGRGSEIRLYEVRSDKMKRYEVAEILKYGLDEEYTSESDRQINQLSESTFSDQPDLPVDINESSLSRIYRKTQAYTCGAISGYRDENSKSENSANNRMIKNYLLGKGYSVTAVEGNYIENLGAQEYSVVREDDRKTEYLTFPSGSRTHDWTDKANRATVYTDKKEAERAASEYSGEVKKHVREVVEPSFFVCNHGVEGDDGGELRKDLVKMGKKTDQDSVLIVPYGGKGAYLLGTSRRENAFPPYGQTETVGSGRYGRAAGDFLSRIRGRAFAFEEVEPPSTRNGKWAQSAYAKRLDREFKDIGE